jgi:hypothetical protein
MQCCFFYAGSVSDPDPNPDPHSMGSWILIRIANADPNPDPEGGKSAPKKEGKVSLTTRKNYRIFYFLCNHILDKELVLNCFM